MLTFVAKVEAGLALLDTQTLTIISTKQIYVKPTVNPRLSAFCSTLTGIEQVSVDDGVPLEQCLGEIRGWLKDQGLKVDAKGLGFDWLFVTWTGTAGLREGMQLYCCC